MVSVLEFLARRELKSNVWSELKISVCRMTSYSVNPIYECCYNSIYFCNGSSRLNQVTPLYKHNFIEMDWLCTRCFEVQRVFSLYANYFPLHSCIKKRHFFCSSQESFVIQTVCCVYFENQLLILLWGAFKIGQSLLQ